VRRLLESSNRCRRRGEEVVGVVRSRRKEVIVVIAAAAVRAVVKSALARAMNEGIEQPHYHSQRIPGLCSILANHVARIVAAPASVVFTRADVT
jgi:hypothetical protein